MKNEAGIQKPRKGSALSVPVFLASCFLLSGCASFERQFIIGYQTASGQTVSVSARWRDGKAVLPPENGPDTTYKGFYDSDGIWRSNFGP